MNKLHYVFSLITLGVILGESSFAQDSELASRASIDPNGFVSEVQQKLKDAKLYNGAVNGRLTVDTIRSINKLCSRAGKAEECRSGPLTPVGAIAIAEALQSIVGSEPKSLSDVTNGSAIATDVADGVSNGESQVPLRTEAVLNDQLRVDATDGYSEIVSNGSFDSGLDGWLVFGGRPVVGMWDGGKLKMVRGTGGNDGAPSQQIKLEEGMHYRLDVTVAGGPAAFLVDGSDQQYIRLPVGNNSVLVRALTGNNKIVLWPLEENSTSYVDDIRMYGVDEIK